MTIGSLSSDVVLVLLFPVAFTFLGYRLFPSFRWRDVLDLAVQKTHTAGARGPFSLERAFNSYKRYPKLSKDELSRMRSSYAKLSWSYRQFGFKIGYTKKLDRLQSAIDGNAKVTRAIAQFATKEFSGQLDDVESDVSNIAGADLGRVREAMKHFIRDWSVEGKTERDRIFAPILRVLSQDEGRNGKKVLVPGSGLGRLAWDISQLGYETTANELSFFMTLAFRFLLSPETTPSVDAHSIQPYAHWFSHQKTNDSTFRSIAFPDTLPRLSPNSFHVVEQDFMTLKMPNGYDYIVTLFFIDTSLNVIATIEKIHALLKPGGTWINLGPLLWTGGAQARVELSLDEVLDVVEKVGFVIDTPPIDDDSAADSHFPPRSHTVGCEYTADKNAMMKWVYSAEFWVARKSK